MARTHLPLIVLVAILVSIPLLSTDTLAGERVMAINLIVLGASALLLFASGHLIDHPDRRS